MSNDTFKWTDKLVEELIWDEYGDAAVRFKVEKFKQSNMPKTEKPPIGVIPMWMHNEQRLDELNKAISRYDRANMAIPKEWICEKESLDAYMKGKLESWRKEMMGQPIQFRYSNNELQEAEEKAFNAAREDYCDTAMGKRPKYWTFQDYLNSKK